MLVGDTYLGSKTNDFSTLVRTSSRSLTIFSVPLLPQAHRARWRGIITCFQWSVLQLINIKAGEHKGVFMLDYTERILNIEGIVLSWKFNVFRTICPPLPGFSVWGLQSKCFNCSSLRNKTKGATTDGIEDRNLHRRLWEPTVSRSIPLRNYKEN